MITNITKYTNKRRNNLKQLFIYSAPNRFTKARTTNNVTNMEFQRNIDKTLTKSIKLNDRDGTQIVYECSYPRKRT